MKHIISITFGIVLSLLGFSVYYGDFVGFRALFIVSPLILAAFFIIKKIRTAKTSNIILAIYAAAVYVYEMIHLHKFFYFDAFSITVIVYLIIQIVFAVLATKVEQNGTFGIRTPFTMDYKPVWKRSNDFMSIAQTSTIPLILALSVLSGGWPRFWLGTGFVLLPLVISLLYSNIIGWKYHKAAEERRKEELKRQQEIENGYQKWKRQL